MDGPILNLFGQPSLSLEGEAVELKSRKGWALLTYLVLNTGPVSRESLATLFWPEHEPVGGRRNLRRLLYTVNQTPVGRYLHSDGELLSLDWGGEIDVRSFLEKLEAGDWGSAVALYTGHLLDGVVIGDSNRFAAWLNDEREQLRQQMLQALTALTDEQLAGDHWLAAESTVRKQLSLDNWNELLWRRLMTILAESGRRAQALSEYNNCQQLLKKELGVTASNETVALYESIRDGRFGTTSEGGQHFAVPPPVAVPHPAARDALLYKLEENWLRPVLGAMGPDRLIALKRTSQPTALAYPWTTLIQRPQTKRRLVPPDRSISELFDQEGRGLLILGEPGGGKTTTLLTLAAEKLERAKVDGAHPLPIVLNLASWSGQSFNDWVKQEINEKYRIIETIVSDWLDGNHLLLLCDGLDELPLDLQPGCVAAINRFREEHGLTAIAVCARESDYDALPTPLNLNGAVMLQPLDKNQIEEFLSEPFVGLRTLLSKQKKLQKMAQTPLFLSLMTAISANQPADQLAEIADNPSKLFGLYVRQMASSQADSENEGDSAEFLSLLHHLQWLAAELKGRNRPVFLLDRIQPDWLGSQRQIRFYFFISRFLGAFILALAWSFRDAGLGAIPFSIGAAITVCLVELLLLRLGRLQDGRFLAKRWTRLFANQPRVTDALLISFRRALIMGGIVALAGSWLGWVALLNGLIFGLFFGWRAPKHTADDDIRLVEKLAWSWRYFGVGVGIGLSLGVIVFFYNRSDLYAVGTGLLSFVVLFGTFAGLQGRTSSTKTRPNEGMWLSLRNSLLGGAVVGGAMLLAALGIEIGRNGPLLIPFLVGLQYFVMAGLWYGGLDLINHFTLRGFLAASGKLPWRTAQFLEQVSRKRLMYRVGSGYRFLHAGLRDYFVEADL